MKIKKPEYPPNTVSREAVARGVRPTLARASPALPSAKEPLTSVFGMRTGVTTPLWHRQKAVKLEQLGIDLEKNYNFVHSLVDFIK